MANYSSSAAAGVKGNKTGKTPTTLPNVVPTTGQLWPRGNQKQS